MCCWPMRPCVYIPPPPPPLICSFCWIDYCVPMSLFGFSSQEHVGGGQVKKKGGAVGSLQLSTSRLTNVIRVLI